MVETLPDITGEREGRGPAGTVGDGREGDVRIAEQFKGPCKTGFLDLLYDGVPRGGAEADLGLTARAGEGVENLAGAEAVRRVALAREEKEAAEHHLAEIEKNTANLAEKLDELLQVKG